MLLSTGQLFGTTGGGGGGGTDPNFASVVLLLGFEGADAATTTSDESSAAHGAATFVGNAQLDTAQFKFGVSSLLLDGTGDYIQYADSPSWFLGTAPFTIEGFFRFAATPTNANLISQWAGSGTWQLWFESGKLYFRDGNAHLSQQYTWSPSLNTWYHIVAERDASNVMRLYVDGSMVSKVTGYTYNIGDTADTFQIGSWLPSGTGGFDMNGWVDEVRITKGVARYASDSGYAPITTAFPRS